MSNTPNSFIRRYGITAKLQQEGVDVVARGNVNFTGDAVDISDDPTNDASLVSISTVVARTIASTSTSITAGQAVMQKNGQLAIAKTASLPLGLTHAGIALDDGIAGETVHVVTQGLVDPTVVTLGAGVACAVGTDASGNPVRVTDAACVSGLKYLGVCDANGAIYVSPRYAAEVDLADFGALGDGTTDDTASVQAAINVHLAVGSPLRARAGTYAISTELAIPPVSSGPSGFDVRGEGWATGTDTARTIFKASASIRSLLTIARQNGRIRDVKFEGNGQASYGLYLQGVSFSRFDNCNARNCIIDGFHLASTADSGYGGGHVVNDACSFDSCVGESNGILYATSGVAAQYTGLRSVQTVAGTVATNGTYVLAFTSAPDLTTLGIRVGDIIRIGTAHDATTQYYQIGKIADASTIHLSGSRFPSGTASGLDFAIGVGDGYHEEQSNDNNVMRIRGGAYQKNAGYGALIAGFYGPENSGATLFQNNGGFGLGIGYGGGSGGVTTVATVLGTAFVRPYFEANFGGDVYAANGTSFDFVQPLLSNTYNQIIADTTYAAGYYSDGSGMHAFGLDGQYQSNIYALRGHNFTNIGTFVTPETVIDIPGASSTISAAGSFRSFTLSNGDQTLTSTPSIAAGTSGQRVTLFNVSGTHTLTLQRDSHLAGTALKLEADTLAIGPHQSVELTYTVWDGGGYWVQTGKVVAAA